jgi:hypothetical protein
MANKTIDGKYQCFYCLKTYNKPEEADSCRESHDLVYIPASRSDLNRLINFIVYPDMKILRGVRLIELLFEYARTPKST